MKNKIINLLAIIVIGGISGIFGVRIFLPWLAGFSFFEKFDWIRSSRDGTTIINRTERVVVTENQALEEAIEKASKIVVGVTAQRTQKSAGGPLRQNSSLPRDKAGEASKKISLAKPEVLARGTGFIVSSDGLIVTTENLAPQGAQKILAALDGKNVEAEVKKIDKTSGLALLKVNENNLPVLPFVENNLKLGERVFLLAVASSSQGSLFVDLSIVKETPPVLTAGFAGKEINGSPVFNIKAELVGINSVAASGENKVIGTSQIKDLLK